MANDRERIDEADEESRKECAAHRPNAAYDDDDKGQDQHRIAHAGLNGQNRCDHCAGKSRKHRAETEQVHEQPANVDPERDTIRAFVAPARISIPTRVRLTST